MRPFGIGCALALAALAGCTARSDVVFELTVRRGAVECLPTVVECPATVRMAVRFTARDPDSAGDDFVETATTVERAWPGDEGAYVVEFLLGPDALSIEADVTARDENGRLVGRAGTAREFAGAGHWSASLELQPVPQGTNSDSGTDDAATDSGDAS